jgi:hypothetical protein
MKIEDYKYGIKRICLSPNEYKEGLEVAKNNQINGLFLWHGGNDAFYNKELTLDLSWLSDLPELKYVEIGHSLSAKSNINSLYSLKNLEYLVYRNYDKLPLDHSKFVNLKFLYTLYSKNHLEGKSRFDQLPNLETLKLWHIKKEESCLFLGALSKLKRLELTWSRTLKTLEGIENYKMIESMSLRNLSQLENVSAINELEKLKGLWVENCKKINEDGKKIIKDKDF